MQCPRCAVDNLPATKFCRGCGAQFGLTCAACGRLNAADSRFCSDCGRALAAPVASQLVLEDERKQVTILFADLKGSLEMLLRRDPEEARRILDPVLERMMVAVQEYGGTVNQVLGDGIMALFGAPRAQEDHAVRACFAALGIQDSIRRFAAEQDIALQVRIGLNSDEVVVRSIGGDLRSDYTAVGMGTHLAARMEQLARPGAILATSATKRFVEGYVALLPLGPTAVKGLDQPIDVYEVTGLGVIGSRVQSAAAHGFSRFVGRDAEMAEVRATLARVLEGHGQMVAAVGDAGVGKSRLIWEFLHLPELAGWQILEARTDPYARNATYRPIIAILEAYFGLREGQSREAIHAAVLQQLAASGHEQLRAPVLALLDLPVADREWPRFDPAQQRRRTIDAIRTLLLLASQRAPVCLVIEDLHWIDSETEAVLDNLTQALATHRMLFVVSCRPEYQPRWSSRIFYRQMWIEPLRPRDADALLCALIGDAPELAELRQRLVERTQGNPFFLEESVRHLVETKSLMMERGQYRLASPLQSIETPPTVHAVLAARIDLLPTALKHVLQAAAAIGPEVSRTLLQTITGLSQDAAAEALAQFQAANLLDQAEPPAMSEYRFKHALTLEVAYRGLLRERRRALDAAIVKAIETLYANDLMYYIDRLAHHCMRGELWPKAVVHSSAAGRKAFGLSAHRAAVKHFEDALTALKHLPVGDEAVRTAIDLRLDLRNSLMPLGEFERTLEYLREAEQLATSAGDRQRRGWAACHLTVHFFLKGDYEQAIESGRRALALGGDLTDSGVQAVANLCLGQAHHSLGSFRESIGYLNTAVASLQGALARERFGMTGLPSVAAHTWLVWCCSELGEFDEGVRRGDQGLQLAESVGEPWSIASATFAQGLLRTRRGDAAAAIPLLQGGLEKCRAYDIRTWLPPLGSALGHALVLAGDCDRGVPLLEEAVTRAASMKMLFRHSLRLAWLGEGLLQKGDYGRAAQIAQDALDLARRHRERGHEAYALRVMGLIALHPAQASAADAGATLAGAIGLAQSLGMRPLQAWCHRARADWHRQKGETVAARADLERSIGLARGMGMTALQNSADSAMLELG